MNRDLTELIRFEVTNWIERKWAIHRAKILLKMKEIGFKTQLDTSNLMGVSYKASGQLSVEKPPENVL